MNRHGMTFPDYVFPLMVLILLFFIPSVVFADDEIVDFETEFDDEANDNSSAVGNWVKDNLQFNLRIDFGLNGVIYPNRDSEDNFALTFDQSHNHFVVSGTLKNVLSVKLDLTNSFNQITLHMGPNFELYFGKILIPFGNIDQHHLYGGRVEESGTFLPITWSNLGLGFRAYIAQRKGNFAMYVLNGFPNPTGDLATFNYMPTEDTNTLKAFGIRYQHKLTRNFNLSASILADFPAANNSWKDHLFLYGLDTEIKFKAFTIRAGITLHEVYLESAGSPDRFIFPASYLRTGTYVETRYDFSERTALRFRFGHLDRNSQLENAEDEINMGPGLILNFGILELVSEYNLMFHTFPNEDEKDNYQNTFKITAVISI